MRELHSLNLMRRSVKWGVMLVFFAAIGCWAQVEMKEVSPPEVSDSLLANRAPAAPLPPVPADPLISFDPAKSGCNGQLVYSVLKQPLEKQEYRTPYNLIVRKDESIVGFAVGKPEVAEIMYDPLVSPDGKYVALKFGWPHDNNGKYRVYIWNLQSKTLTVGPQEKLSYPLLQWSPDGRYISYIAGGDQEGTYDQRRTPPIELKVFDLETTSTSLIIRDEKSIAHSWTDNNSILFCASRSANDNTNNKADVYEYYIPSGISKSVIKDVYSSSDPLLRIKQVRPEQSLDGRWIAFAALPNTEDEYLNINDKKVVHRPFVMLYDRKTNKRLAIRPIVLESYDIFRWSRNGNLMRILEVVPSLGKQKCEVLSFDVETKTVSTRGQIELNSELPDRLLTDPLFSFASNYPNDHIFIKTKQYIGPPKDGYYRVVSSLYSLNQSEERSAIAVFESYFGTFTGFDWHCDN